MSIREILSMLNIPEATVTSPVPQKPRDNKLVISLRRSVGFWIILPMFLVLIFLIVYPYFTLIYGALTDEPPRQLSFSLSALTLEKFHKIFTNPHFWEALGNTLITSVIILSYHQLFGRLVMYTYDLNMSMLINLIELYPCKLVAAKELSTTW